MARLIDGEYPSGGFRTEFNMCMRAIRSGWLTDEKAQALLDEAMAMAKNNQLPLRQLRQMLTAYAKHKARLLEHLDTRFIDEANPERDLDSLIGEFAKRPT